LREPARRPPRRALYRIGDRFGIGEHVRSGVEHHVRQCELCRGAVAAMSASWISGRSRSPRG
jgi:hypothetical protein